MTSPTLPYFRDAAQLPGPLPTRDEIEAVTARLPSNRDPRFRQIVVVRDCFVVKHGVHVDENEGHALLFVEKHLSVPAPRLLAMYREEHKLYIVMEFMPGKTLQDIWEHLSEKAKISILQQLRSIWDKMRALPSPGYFGSVTNGPLQHRFVWPTPDPRITGPFAKEEDLDLALALRSQLNWESNDRRGWTSEFFARHLPLALKGHQIKFTHSDLQRKNILVEEIDGKGHEEKRFRVSAVLDWEEAAWYPSYWEYAACFVDFQWTDWPEKVEEILDPWPLESAMLKLVRQDLDY